MSHTPGPWVLWTSNSWRRFCNRDGHSVCEPIKQSDGHPDLHFQNGGETGPDAHLIAAAPDLLEALKDIQRRSFSESTVEMVAIGLIADAALKKAKP